MPESPCSAQGLLVGAVLLAQVGHGRIFAAPQALAVEAFVALPGNTLQANQRVALLVSAAGGAHAADAA